MRLFANLCKLFLTQDTRRIAQKAGLSVAGCLGVLEIGARQGLVPDLRAAYMDLLRQGVRFDLKLLQDSLTRLGLPKL
jgi:predicted nucleic acid-binding protein